LWIGKNYRLQNIQLRKNIANIFSPASRQPGHRNIFGVAFRRA
jgi:hypothetical protein